MKNFFKVIALLVAIAIHCLTYAQVNLDASGSKSPGIMAIGLHGGFPTIGADIGLRLSGNFMLRARYGTLAFSRTDFPFTLDGNDLLFDIELNMQNVDFLLDIHPSKTGSFKFVAGLGYLMKNKIQAVGKFKEGTTYNEIEFTAEDMGSIGTRISWATLSPYVGFGFGRAVPKRRVGFGIEFGTYYGGAPNAEILATGMLRDSKQNEHNFRESMKEFAWIPQVLFRLSIKLF